eukprot:CAMPEP_0171263986 /NCGR_PEP_ID=MMETSP0790-20130122/57383_1 /TAXON_ID=2925 /ORGANISM="Alexandrium catenella, Strain OF101" /LENGTH=62 /DNA_ID=CAMNT_0011732623 /DNA_START=56 /DNA_END=241 /DNA_ORIENTATION=-
MSSVSERPCKLLSGLCSKKLPKSRAWPMMAPTESISITMSQQLLSSPLAAESSCLAAFTCSP